MPIFPASPAFGGLRRASPYALCPLPSALSSLSRSRGRDLRSQIRNPKSQIRNPPSLSPAPYTCSQVLVPQKSTSELYHTNARLARTFYAIPAFSITLQAAILLRAADRTPLPNSARATHQASCEPPTAKCRDEMPQPHPS
jgi:hypothetical protein